jgi:hypothetical protein
VSITPKTIKKVNKEKATHFEVANQILIFWHGVAE